MDVNDYITEAERQLKTRNSMRRTIEERKETVNDMIETFRRDHLSPTKSPKIQVSIQNPATPRFKILPKVHKRTK